MHNAGSFAENFNWAHTSATRSKNICIENAKRCAVEIAAGDLLNKLWHIDMGWAGAGTGSVKTIQAAVRLNHCSLRREWRMQVPEPLCDLWLLLE
ncbi:hypothetical protein GCM10011585_16060 [Edaphobacter dinghuensis]|uniref:Uncharacterized protein n=1 Tax=Edaphobacter dinghuensis TaxID=1560005 RepID=A0A917HC09_9BACT|nr:hypothetical protein GCM10011585_16060 [Edaphobacter dinghuensis]